MFLCTDWERRLISLNSAETTTMWCDRRKTNEHFTWLFFSTISILWIVLTRYCQQIMLVDNDRSNNIYCNLTLKTLSQVANLLQLSQPFFQHRYQPHLQQNCHLRSHQPLHQQSVKKICKKENCHLTNSSHARFPALSKWFPQPKGLLSSGGTSTS